MSRQQNKTPAFVAKGRIDEYKAMFLSPHKPIGMGKQIRISRDTADYLKRLLHVIGNDNTCLGNYVEDIIRQHIAENNEIINAIYRESPILSGNIGNNSNL